MSNSAQGIATMEIFKRVIWVALEDVDGRVKTMVCGRGPVIIPRQMLVILGLDCSVTILPDIIYDCTTYTLQCRTRDSPFDPYSKLFPCSSLDSYRSYCPLESLLRW